ncbi:uncharacterized protein LOC107873890 [Capsicum annuum]|uniref:uncharacterized protein LOC107873890 n=1 Tax=Capsicum annuum TaxID=4072 RepID=UPI0007BEE5AD|nr:uncharacterized protein LOC107873890 [Capsicum annuum]
MDVYFDTIEDMMLLREFKLQLAKFHLHRAQQRMRAQANARSSDRHFNVGDWVFVKLQPYRQSSLSIFPYHKLTSRYFGSYPTVEKVGPVAYKLLLPPEVLIHSTFHISQLKIFHEIPSDRVHPPVLDLSNLHCPEPEYILDRRMIKRDNKVVAQ